MKKILPLLSILFLIYWGCEEEVEDCAGVAGGNAVEDNCGVCDNNPENDCLQDCADAWGGSALIDSCGLCDDDTSNDCEEDCAGVWGGDTICGCTDSTARNWNPEANYNDGSCHYNYLEWTVIGNGLDADVGKNALTEFVGSTNCPYCPTADSLLLSYLNPSHVNYVGSGIADRWSLINYHTYSPSRGDPMYEFLRGEEAEDDFCYVRFEEGSWYDLVGVPTTYTNGNWGSISEDMAVAYLDESTPIQMSLDGTIINGLNINVEIIIISSSDLTMENSLYLFIAATLDSVDYTGNNDESHHQDVFLGWITDGFNGELLSITHEEKIKNYTWEMPSNWPANSYETTWSQVEWDPTNLHIVAFIQDQTSKEILQVISY